MPRVTLLPAGKTVVVDEGTSLLEAARLANATDVRCCGITPACGACKANVLAGEEHLSPPGKLEAESLLKKAFLPGERFGCMAHVMGGDVEVELAHGITRGRS